MKSIRLFGLAVLLLGLVVVSVNCASAIRPIETEADFLGFITEISPDGENEVLGRISVESHADKIVTKYVITIEDETLIFEQDGDNLRQTAFEALENKQWVKIWFDGPVMESFPMQATAAQVVITDS
ncbi:MAG: DUF3221 domain-containing protein [Dehalococcoidia bacterium]|jgi:hypothetical protein